MRTLRVLNKTITDFFALWMIAFGVVAYLYPAHFSDLAYLITPALGVIMFGMGITLRGRDFRRVLKRPGDVFVGAGAQYLIMPMLGFLIAQMLGLEPLLAAGMVLVGSCPGGTASNVIAYLARADVALSVSMTATSTLLSPIFVPLLTYLYAGQWIDVPVLKLFISTVEIVLLPVALGAGIRWFFGQKAQAAAEVMPMVSALGIIFVVGVIVAANKSTIGAVGLSTGVAVALHNGLGLVLGYWAARLFGMGTKSARAVSIEVGMQNSGLGVALATAHFGALAALPSAVFSIWHNLVGSGLALWWRRTGEVVGAGDE